MWGFVAQAGATLLGHWLGGRSRERAEDEARLHGRQAYNKARDHGNRAARRLRRDIDKRVGESARRAEGRLARQTGRYERKADRIARDTLSVSEAAATAEREQVMADEATRFVRLREAADAGGFNPLTLLAAGFTGSALPTGVLSADWHLAHGGMKMDAAGTAYTTQTSLDQGIQGARINAAVEGAVAAASHGLNARQLVFDQVMTGHELALQSGAAAYDQTANVFRDLGNIAVSAANAHTDGVRYREGMELDRARLDLDREQFNYERDYNERVFAANQFTGRSAGFGAARIGSWAEPVLSPEGVEMPGFTINGRSFGPDPDVSDPETISTGMGGFWGEVITGVANIDEGIAALDELVFYGPARQLRDDFVNRRSGAGAAWGYIRDLWSSPASYGINVPLSQEELDLVPAWAR